MGEARRRLPLLLLLLLLRSGGATARCSGRRRRRRRRRIAAWPGAAGKMKADRCSIKARGDAAPPFPPRRCSLRSALHSQQLASVSQMVGLDQASLVPQPNERLDST